MVAIGVGIGEAGGGEAEDVAGAVGDAVEGIGEDAERSGVLAHTGFDGQDKYIQSQGNEQNAADGLAAILLGGATANEFGHGRSLGG